MSDIQETDTSISVMDRLDEVLGSIKTLNERCSRSEDSSLLSLGLAPPSNGDIVMGEDGPPSKHLRTQDREEVNDLLENDGDDGSDFEDWSLENDDEDKYLTDLSAVLDDADRCGPAVADKLATVVNKMFREPLSTENVKIR